MSETKRFGSVMIVVEDFSVSPLALSVHEERRRQVMGEQPTRPAAFITTEEYPMKKIVILSALLICLSSMNATAKGCPHAGHCAVSHHSKQAAKKRPAQSMPGALNGAYQR
jgi:hypothetical protein